MSKHIITMEESYKEVLIKYIRFVQVVTGSTFILSEIKELDAAKDFTYGEWKLLEGICNKELFCCIQEVDEEGDRCSQICEYCQLYNDKLHKDWGEISLISGTIERLAKQYFSLRDLKDSEWESFYKGFLEGFMITERKTH